MQDQANPLKVETVSKGELSIDIVRKDDPYRMLQFQLNKGTLPERYQGNYTSIDVARREALIFLEERVKDLEAIRAERKTNKVKTG